MTECCLLKSNEKGLYFLPRLRAYKRYINVIKPLDMLIDENIKIKNISDFKYKLNIGKVGE